MKTTLEIPDALFRQAKAAASEKGLTLKTYVTEALQEKLGKPAKRKSGEWPVPPPKVAESEISKIQSIIDEEFSRIDPELWK